MQLVRVEETGGYAVCREGQAFLASLSPGVPVAVVVVAGRYRSGKSFLLNRGVLGLTQRQGFSTCGSVQACTKGIWIYPSVQGSSDGGAFVVLDTEGTGSLVASAEHDARLVGLSLVLASIFVYNSHGAVDETALSELANLTSVASAISSADSCWTPPQLVWTLRDFTLELFDKDGAPVSSDQYLELALAETSHGKQDARAALRSYFPMRRLFTFVRPCINEVDLQRLNGLANSTLRPEFRKQLETFRKHVQCEARVPKQVGGLGLDGPSLLSLLEDAVQATNAGRAPSVRSTFDFLLQQRVGDALEEARTELREACRALEEALPLPAPLALELPATPAFLLPLQDARAHFERGLEEERTALVRALEELNIKKAAALVQDTLGGAVEWARKGGEGGAAVFLEGCIEGLARRLGAPEALACAPDLFRAGCEALEVKISKLEEAEEVLCSRNEAERRSLLQEHEASTRRLEAEWEEEARRLRLELAEAEARDVHVTREMDEEALVEQRCHFQHEMELMAMERDSQEERARNLRRDLDAALEKQAAQEDDGKLAARLNLRLLELEQDQAQERASRREDVKKLCARQDEELRELQEACRVVSSQHEARASACELEKTEAEKRARAAEERCEEERGRLEEQRRMNAATLAQRIQSMKDAQEGLVAESAKARERALDSERKLMSLEVQTDSLKRRLDQALKEGEELAKLRRVHEDHRVRLGVLEIALQKEEEALEAERKQRRQVDRELGGLTQQLQEERSSNSLRLRIAELEFQTKQGRATSKT